MPHQLVRIGALVVLVPALAVAQTRPAVRPADFQRWESLNTGTLAPDGRWLAYGVNRANEENELRPGATSRDSTVAIPYASAPASTGDSKWPACAIRVSPAERDRPPKDQKPIRNSVGIRN